MAGEQAPSFLPGLHGRTRPENYPWQKNPGCPHHGHKRPPQTPEGRVSTCRWVTGPEKTRRLDQRKIRGRGRPEPGPGRRNGLNQSVIAGGGSVQRGAPAEGEVLQDDHGQQGKQPCDGERNAAQVSRSGHQGRLKPGEGAISRVDPQSMRQPAPGLPSGHGLHGGEQGEYQVQQHERQENRDVDALAAVIEQQPGHRQRARNRA